MASEGSDRLRKSFGRTEEGPKRTPSGKSTMDTVTCE